MVRVPGERLDHNVFRSQVGIRLVRRVERRTTPHGDGFVCRRRIPLAPRNSAGVCFPNGTRTPTGGEGCARAGAASRSTSLLAFACRSIPTLSSRFPSKMNSSRMLAYAAPCSRAPEPALAALLPLCARASANPVRPSMERDHPRHAAHSGYAHRRAGDTTLRQCVHSCGAPQAGGEL